MNLVELLENTVKRYSSKPALIEDSGVVSYAELGDQVWRLAVELQHLHLPAGSRIGLSYPNSVLYVALTFALWKIGAIVVPIPVECTEEDVEHLASSMELQGILSPKPRGNGSQIASDCFFTRRELLHSPDNHGLNIAFIRFTSGTTNASKGVVLSHETIRDRIQAANKALGINADDRIMWCLPMSHHFLITIVLYVSRGATIILSRHLIARSFLEAINRWKGTVLYAAPFHFALLARDTSGISVPSVRLAVSTTCALPEDVAHDFHKRFHLALVQGLGIIEVGLVSLNTTNPLDKWNSVGKLLPDFQVKVLAPDEKGSGEIAVRGPGLLDAYAAPWTPRERILQDGWFIAGDIGRVDGDGCLFLEGRKTAVINLAGRKVFPEEIEAVLNRHPAIRESRVYGRTHPHLGEVVEADIVVEDADFDLNSVRDFCRRNLASFKVPARLHVVNSLPRTLVTGKLRRTAAAA